MSKHLKCSLHTATDSGVANSRWCSIRRLEGFHGISMGVKACDLCRMCDGDDQCHVLQPHDER
jgi:hypothetical protein